MIKNINIVIISSLPDKSMKSIGNKALIDFHGATLIEHQINNIRTIYKKAKIIIVGGFEHKKLHDKIKAKKNISYVYHEYNDYVNVGMAIKKALPILTNKPTIIMNIGFIFNPNIIESLNLDKDNVMINNNNKNFESKIGCIIDKKGRVEFIFYDLEKRLCEFIYLNTDGVAMMKSIQKDIRNNMYLFEILNKLINMGMKLKISETNQNILHFDHMKKLKQTQNILTKLKNANTI